MPARRGHLHLLFPGIITPPLLREPAPAIGILDLLGIAVLFFLHLPDVWI
jgi:hypothetical protein